MEALIPVVNKLQDVFGAIGQQSIDLPQIIVVGSQSAGKSSVLEMCVGRDFLPRGSGVVTRRPLVLQLYCLGSASTDVSASEIEDSGSRLGAPVVEEWGEFLHLPGKKFFDFDEIRDEIQAETDRLTGTNKGISNKSINLKIFSPHVLNLTLVDLPGITRVPTGDQPEDVEEQIRSMCMEFIGNPNAIILAVTAANSDLVNSDGLKMARAVDPEGLRTIGVLTKIDIMDAGTDAVDILNNRVIPLRHGYIAVKNRSQKSIQQQASIRDGLSQEAAFFSQHPSYRNMLNKCGTPNLSRTLNQILMHHIRDTLPDIKSRIHTMLIDTQRQMDGLGEATDTLCNSAQGTILLKMLSNFASHFNDSVEGKGRHGGGPGVEMAELYGGARISYIFNDVFGRSLKSLDPFEGLDDDDIRTAIANANGSRPSLFVPEQSFDLLVRRQVARLEQPGLQCVDLVFKEMQRMAIQTETTELSRFPALRDRVFEIVNSSLRSCVIPTQKMISNLIQIELAYINTNHPDFIGGKQAVAQLNRKLSEQRNNNNPSISDSQLKENRVPIPPVDSTSIPESSDHSSAAALRALQTPLNRMGSTSSSSGAGLNTTGAGGAPGPGYFNLFRPSSQSHNHRSSGNNDTMPVTKKNMEGGLVKLPQVPEKMRSHNSANMTDREKVETEIIKSLLASYFDIVKKNFMDLVPKTIMHFLVNTFRDSLQNELVGELYKEDAMGNLMRETDDVAQRRKACREVKDLLGRAMEIVNEVRDAWL
jgi:dynamin 1-like protein